MALPPISLSSLQSHPLCGSHSYLSLLSSVSPSLWLSLLSLLSSVSPSLWLSLLSHSPLFSLILSVALPPISPSSLQSHPLCGSPSYLTLLSSVSSSLWLSLLCHPPLFSLILSVALPPLFSLILSVALPPISPLQSHPLCGSPSYLTLLSSVSSSLWLSLLSLPPLFSLILSVALPPISLSSLQSHPLCGSPSYLTLLSSVSSSLWLSLIISYRSSILSIIFEVPGVYNWQNIHLEVCLYKRHSSDKAISETCFVEYGLSLSVPSSIHGR